MISKLSVKAPAIIIPIIAAVFFIAGFFLGRPAVQDKNVDNDYQSGAGTSDLPGRKEISLEKHYCTSESRNRPSGCSRLQDPVCGKFFEKSGCFGQPSCSISLTSPCSACLNPDIEYWTYGSCPSK